MRKNSLFLEILLRMKWEIMLYSRVKRVCLITRLEHVYGVKQWSWLREEVEDMGY